MAGTTDYEKAFGLEEGALVQNSILQVAHTNALSKIKLSSAISLKRIADSLEKIEKHLYTISHSQKNEVELAISRRDVADVNK